MAFVKTDSTDIYVGDKVILQKKHESMGSTFEAGTEVTVIGIGVHGYDIEDNESHTMFECGWLL